MHELHVLYFLFIFYHCKKSLQRETEIFFRINETLLLVSTEFYYYLNYGLDPLMNQYYWLQEDLKQVKKTKGLAWP